MVVKNIKILRYLNPKKTAFFLCDVQEKFRTVLPLFKPLVTNTSKLLKAGKVFKVPLVVSEQYPEKLGRIVKELDICHACTIVEKTNFSMYVPEMQCKLKDIFDEAPRDVVLFGIETHACVEQTAMDLIKENINVFVVADCVCSRLNQDRDMALRRLAQIGCLLATSESIIFNLLRDKESPYFCDIKNLLTKPSEDMELSKKSSPPPKGKAKKAAPKKKKK